MTGEPLNAEKVLHEAALRRLEAIRANATFPHTNMDQRPTDVLWLCEWIDVALREIHRQRDENRDLTRRLDRYEHGERVVTPSREGQLIIDAHRAGEERERERERRETES